MAPSGNRWDQKVLYPRKKLSSLLSHKQQKMLSKSPDQSGFGERELIHLYMNGMLMGGLDQLGNISINSVKEMRFLPSAEATTMSGTNNMGGVIEIKSR